MPEPLLLFYEEPDPDRWIPGDRIPRRWLRRLLRGRPQPGGQKIVALNLFAGLERIGHPYRVNRYDLARAHPERPVGIIGKPHVLDHHDWTNPVLFGASVMSHPLADPTLLARHPGIRRILVPGEWMRAMCEPHWPGRVAVWPVGIDTDRWSPQPGVRPEFDVLLYDKIRWDYAKFEPALLNPIRAELARRGLGHAHLRYGFYREEQFADLLPRCRAMIFLCEHETQGLAYQQALACGVPILAWDRGGFWQDPQYFPDRVKFAPVSAVPYWDARCGHTFPDVESFPSALDAFWRQLGAGGFSPRDYVVEHLTLEAGARGYLAHWREVFGA
jgi:glycosyltransferase involved in cell wall biosynthesis